LESSSTHTPHPPRARTSDTNIKRCIQLVFILSHGCSRPFTTRCHEINASHRQASCHT
jgi:hypothetical protein